MLWSYPASLTGVIRADLQLMSWSELGYATPDSVREAIEVARTAGRSPEALLLEQGAVNSDQLSRAIAERYGLDHLDPPIFTRQTLPPLPSSR